MRREGEVGVMRIGFARFTLCIAGRIQLWVEEATRANSLGGGAAQARVCSF